MRLSANMEEAALFAPSFYESTRFLVKCKVHSSPECYKRHYNDKPCCGACAAFEKKKKRGLSKRESEVLCRWCNGMSGKETASDLGTSPKTVEKQRASIKNVLNIRNAMHLVHYALHKGIIKNRFEVPA
jgi:DNA-binding CsgD family transcriptional regulator